MSQNSTLFVKWEFLLHELLDSINRFPKSQRFVFGQRLSNLVLDIYCDICKLQYIPKTNTNEKKEILERIDQQLFTLRSLLRICCQRRYLSINQLEKHIENILECGQMIGGWKRHVTS